MEYTVRVSKNWYRSDVIPIYKVAEAMARHAADGHGPTLKNIRPDWYSLLLEDARDGKLLVCNEVGQIASVRELIKTSTIPADWSEQNKMHALYVKVKHLNEWGASNGNVFHIFDSPGKVTVFDLKDWETGKVLIPGYFRSYVDGGDEPEKPQADTTAPANPEAPAANMQTGGPVTTSQPDKNADDTRAALFDPVTVAVLEKMFNADGKWKNWAERAASNGLIYSRMERGKFNPYTAGLWFLKRGIAKWDTAKLFRVLVNNLPARSIDSKYLLGSEYSD